MLAGLTVAAIAVPQALAYGLVAGVPPEHSLYTAIVMTAIGAIFDSSRQLINGPTNAISIAILSSLGAIAAPDQKLQAAITLAFLVGAIQIGITLLRLGDLTRYISHSVIVGFTAGAGSLLVFDQLKNLLGLQSVGGVHDHFLTRFWLSMTRGGSIHPETLAIGLGSIALVLLLRAIKQRLGWVLFPEFLFVVVAMAALVAVLGLDARGVRLVGEIPAKLPSFEVPRLEWARVRELSSSAGAIAVLGLLEAIAMAKAISAQTRQKLDVNQQCLSEGLANLGGSFFQCIPGSGSLTRSAMNQQAGARTQWSGVISALAVALVVVLFAPYARFIPKAALAGILLVASFRMIDREALKYHLRASRFDAAIVAATAISAVVVSVEFCVLIGVFMSFLLTVPRAGRMLLTEFVVSAQGVIQERLAHEPACGRILVFGLEGEAFFAAATSLEEHLDNIEARIDPGIRVIVLRVKRVRSPDAVCLTLLASFIDRVKARGVHVLICGVRPELHEALVRTGLEPKLGPDHVFQEQGLQDTATLQAIRKAYELLTDHCANCPRREPSQRGSGLYYAI